MEGVGQIPSQGRTQAGGETNLEREGRRVGITPAEVRDRRGVTSGGGKLRLSVPEHSRTVYCDQDHYGPVSGVGAETGATNVQAVVGTGRSGFGGDAGGGLGGGTDEGGG